MNAIERRALDDAYASEVQGLFGTLVDNMVTGQQDAPDKFARGLIVVREAYWDALAVLAQTEEKPRGSTTEHPG